LKNKIIFTVLIILSSFSLKAQNDTMFFMKNGVVFYQQSVKSTDVDSIIFYNPLSLIKHGTPVTDISGNVYNTVIIGTQEWMQENLKTTKYNDGTLIPLETDNTAWTTLVTPAYCWYNNNQAIYGNVYGALYNWYAVNTNKLCPSGWHVPSYTEWTTLINSVSPGGLKEVGTAHWWSPNTGATNSSGFTGRPGGIRFWDDGTFNDEGSTGYWWTNAAYNSSLAYRAVMFSGLANVIPGYHNMGGGYSVRCIKD
jgi:uncharacterized protein (TIGR02145 family)